MCDRSTRLGADALGRTFRCTHCGTKLPRVGEVSPPWEDEEEDVQPGRTLGLAMRSRLGRFQVRGLLSVGTHATIYRAFDPEREREVALKVPLAGSSMRFDRFLSEARALARLRHPAIATVFEAGRIDETPYMTTAIIEGSLLSRELENGPFSFSRAARITADLAEALAHAHEHGVAHRDVQPAHVRIEPAGNVVLTDFGIGVLFGMPAYLAPELAECGSKQADSASDQYSLGVVLYELICGRPHFLGSPALVLDSVQHDDPMPPRLLRPGIPPTLERICLKALARDPARRYSSCEALAAALRDWLDRKGTRRLARQRRTRALSRASTWLRKRPAATVSAILAVLGLTASAILVTALVVAEMP